MQQHPLREWRTKQQLTQAQLGERLGKSIYDIHRIEAGKQRTLGLTDAMRIVSVTRGRVTLQQLADAHPG